MTVSIGKRRRNPRVFVNEGISHPLRHIIGLGLLAARDTVAFLRHGSAENGNPCAGDIRRAYAFGTSQSGRYLRQFLYLGLNGDEEERMVFDGVLVDIAGEKRGGDFNQRFGQP